MSTQFVGFVVLVGTLVGCAFASMSIITLPNAVKNGAMCMDGSPAAYYFRPASSALNSSKWVLFIQGGGWCYTEEECAARAHTRRGSSKYMPPTIDDGGMISEDPFENPDFFSWNHAYFAYCDGASFTGAADKPIDVHGQKLYFRGFSNLKAIMNDLLQYRGLGMATEVLLAGGSAGGLSVFIHADQIRDWLPITAKKRFKAVPASGLFLKHDNVNDEPVFENQMRYIFAMQNSTAGVDSHCLLAKSPMYMYLCMFGSETIRSTETPMFVMNSMYDAWSTSCIMTAEPEAPSAVTDDGNCSAVPGWANCLNTLTCTSEQWNEFNTKWGDDFRATVKSDAFLRRGNGLFAYSCHSHVAETTGHWNKIAINGVTMRQAFIKWYVSTDDDASKHTYIDCKINGNFNCNPTCAL